jgi:undecaprenyl-diphosphatase
LWVAAVVGVLVVGLDRIALGVHYVSDVLAAWVVGMAIVAATVAGFELWRRDEGLGTTGPDEGLDPEQGPARASTAW